MEFIDELWFVAFQFFNLMDFIYAVIATKN
jgi:hypothetical protein